MKRFKKRLILIYRRTQDCNRFDGTVVLVDGHEAEALYDGHARRDATKDCVFTV